MPPLNAGEVGLWGQNWDKVCWLKEAAGRRVSVVEEGGRFLKGFREESSAEKRATG